MLFKFVFSICVAQTFGLFGLPTVLPKNPLSDVTEPILGDLPINIPSDLASILPSELTKNFLLQPETLLNTEQLVRYYGFPCQVHTCYTKDGYILNMHRIPGGKNRTADPKLIPILVVHGTLGYADHFLANTPDNNFPLLLAQAGFDVWLANCRGTINSRLHQSLNPNSEEYWNFSWDEMAALDVPAFIDYILNTTGSQQLYYAGHSLGGALPFALGATKPDYMSKIRAIFALAPMGNLANISEPLKLIFKAEPLLKLLSDAVDEIPGIPSLVAALLGKYLDPIVQQLIFALVGPDYQEWDSNRTEVKMAHYFTSTASKVLVHQAQMVNKEKFCKFDRGVEENQKRYGQPTAPDYDVSGINVPSYLYYGENDGLCPKNNAQFFHDRLGNSTLIRAGLFWNHIDFLWAKNAKAFYNILVDSIKNFVK